jgi:rod shape determining protein RodA
MPILFVMLFVAGAKVKHLLLVIVAAMAISPILWWKLPTYQRERVSSVLLQFETIREATEKEAWLQMLLADPGFSAKKWMYDKGYQLIRSKDAIASAGWSGHGFREGPFIQYSFLSFRMTDFIFAAIAQQWGFLGCLSLLGLYGIIVVCGLRIAANNTDPFGRLVVVGILTMFVMEVFVNVSMTMGIMPITGLTLPFVSYGGSSLLVSLMSIGLLNNIGRCRAFTVAKTE